MNHKQPLNKRKADSWDIEAENFIRRNLDWNRGRTRDVKSLARFLSKHSVSLLALRSESAVKFLDILEMVCAPGTYRPIPTQRVLNNFIDVGCAQ